MEDLITDIFNYLVLSKNMKICVGLEKIFQKK